MFRSSERLSDVWKQRGYSMIIYHLGRWLFPFNYEIVPSNIALQTFEDPAMKINLLLNYG